MAAAIALGATSMSDIAVLGHLVPVLGDAPSGPTVRRALDLAGTPAVLDRIARARAKARAHVWKLIEDTPAGFPWLVIAGKTLTGWLVIDMDDGFPGCDQVPTISLEHLDFSCTLSGTSASQRGFGEPLADAAWRVMAYPSEALLQR